MYSVFGCFYSSADNRSTVKIFVHSNEICYRPDTDNLPMMKFVWIDGNSCELNISSHDKFQWFILLQFWWRNTSCLWISNSRSHRQHSLVGQELRSCFPCWQVFLLLCICPVKTILLKVYTFIAVLKIHRSEKKKRIQPERVMLEQDAVDGELSTLDFVEKRTSAKRQKHLEESWM